MSRSAAASAPGATVPARTQLMAGHLAVGPPRGARQPGRGALPGRPYPVGDRRRRLAATAPAQQIGAGRPAPPRPADRRGRAAVRTAAPGSGGSPRAGIRTRAPCRVCRPQGQGLAASTIRNRAGQPHHSRARARPPHARIPAAAAERPAPGRRTRESRPGTARPGAPATPRRAAAVRCRRRRATASSPNGAGRSRAAHVDQRLARRQHPRHRVHGGDLQGLLPGQRRQQPGQPLREHRLAGARRPVQEAGGGRPPRRPPAPCAPCAARRRRPGRARVPPGGPIASPVPAPAPGTTQPGQHRVRAALLVAGSSSGTGSSVEYGDQLTQAAHAEHGDARHQRGLGGGALRHDHLPVAGVGRGQHRRAALRAPAAPGRPGPAPRSSPGRRCTRGSMRSAAPSTAQATARSKPLPLLGTDAGLSPTVSFFCGHSAPELTTAARTRSRLSDQALVRQPHQRERRHPRLQVRLDLDHHALDAHQRHRARTREPHSGHPPRVLDQRARRGRAARTPTRSMRTPPGGGPPCRWSQRSARPPQPLRLRRA